MLYAVKPSVEPYRPPQTHREPTGEGGHDAHDMRAVLRNALRTLSATPLPVSQLRTYADYLETMALAGPTRWFAAPSFLAASWREYFELADRVEFQLTAAAPDPDAEQAKRILVSAMTLLTSRVLAFASQEGRSNPKAISVPLVATAARASSRTRRWCSAEEPGKPQRLGVLSYSVIDVAAQAVERLSHDDSCTTELVQETADALDEVLATLKQLAVNHPPNACFDEGIGGHMSGQPSRAVRALQGLAWSHDVLGQAGVVPTDGQLDDMLRLVEGMWPLAHTRDNEARGLVGATAHLTSAWATLIDTGASKTTLPATRALWLARQASARAADDPGLAQGLLDVAQAVAAFAGISIQRGLGNGVGTAIHTADLVRTIVQRCGPRLPTACLMGPLENLTRVASDANERGLADCSRLLDQVTGIAAAANIDRTS
jgi:hypothetical protein